jgi:tRNA threonylcarbamoyladenosine biosynthesis protein TsaE
MQEHIIKNISELHQAVEVLLNYAAGRKKLCFSGQLGAGKTTFVKAFCHHFKVKEKVTSPTYSLINEYTYADESGAEQKMYHMDLYRLNRPEEAFDIGLEDYLYDDNFTLIEWFEIVEDWLPEDAVIIKIEMLPDSSRKMIFL